MYSMDARRMSAADRVGVNSGSTDSICLPVPALPCHILRRRHVLAPLGCSLHESTTDGRLIGKLFQAMRLHPIDPVVAVVVLNVSTDTSPGCTGP